MSSPRRPTLEDAARAWLRETSAEGQAEALLRDALTDFVDKRFRGAAGDLRRVHEIRLRLLDDPRPLKALFDVPDRPGDGASLGSAAKASATSEQGRLLFHLARAFRPDSVLELGTNLGISAAYLATGVRYGGGGRVITIEQSLARLEQARSHLRELGIDNVDVIEGDFDEALPSVLDGIDRLGMAFIDGNHDYEATLRYVDRIRPQMRGGILVLDDIRWSEGMSRAWDEICAHPTAEAVVDLGRTGIVVVADVNRREARSPRLRSILRRRS